MAELKFTINELIRLFLLGVGLPTSGALTASRAVTTNSAGALAAATTTSTEIGYVNGVTSAIQTQIDTKLAATITSAAAAEAIIRNAGNTAWINRPILGTEVALNTPVAGANDTVLGTGPRYYTYFTVPTTAPLWFITAGEWLNGTVVNGNSMVGIDYIEADPPVLATTVLCAQGAVRANTGASALQKVDIMRSPLVAGGTLLGAYLSTDSATQRAGTTTVGSANRTRTISMTNALANGSNVAWNAGTEEPYIKIYGRPVLGV